VEKVFSVAYNEVYEELSIEETDLITKWREKKEKERTQ
jgi:hypothetical protein